MSGTNLIFVAAQFPGGYVPDAGVVESWFKSSRLATSVALLGVTTDADKAVLDFAEEELDNAIRGRIASLMATGGDDLLRPHPMEDDGKPVYVMSPSTEGLYTWLTARGDNLNPTPPSSGRGEGQQLYLSWDGTEDPWPSTKEVVLDWCEPVELHDGHMNWDPTKWSFQDEWSFFVRLPANTPVVNAGGTGNCNLVEIPGTGGTMHIIVPAAGDGGHDIDLDAAVPAPCSIDEDGYWGMADRWADVIAPNLGPIKGTWNLYDFPIEMNFMKNLNCGDPRGVWDLDAYKAEWICSRWKMVLRCTRITEGAAEIGGDLMCFRPGAI